MADAGCTRREVIGTVLLGGVAVTSNLSRAGAAAPADGLERAIPEAVGISSQRVLDLLESLRTAGFEMNSFMLWRHGKVAAEGWWWPYGPKRVHMLHSATKALTSTAAGLALAEKRFALDDKVISFFPDKLPPDVSPNLAAMTIEHLLSQTCGHEKGISGSKWRAIKTSWITEFLKEPVTFAPGTHFAYSSATSFMLSAIITRTTGLSLHDYLKPRFLDPLGITTLQWDMGPEGINPGGNGASAKTADFLKIAACYQGQGKWNGKQILPASWPGIAGSPKMGHSYGYHWWIAPDGLGYFAYGLFGQFAFVFPELDMILVTTAAIPDGAGAANPPPMHCAAASKGCVPQPVTANSYALQTLPPVIWQLAPGLCESRPPDRGAAARLKRQLQTLALLPTARSSHSPLAASIDGRRYIPQVNDDGVSAVEVRITGDRGSFTLETMSGQHKIEFGLGRWVEGDTSMPGAGLHHGYEPHRLRVVASGNWLRPDRLELVWQFVETSFRDTVTLDFAGDALVYARSVNVNSGKLSRPAIRALALPLPAGR